MSYSCKEDIVENSRNNKSDKQSKIQSGITDEYIADSILAIAVGYVNSTVD